jgi:hypothetical protein
MKKVVRLTESDLTRIIKRVIQEQSVGNKISGTANDGGNRPIEVVFKVTGNNAGILTSWGYSSKWGTKVGDPVMIKKIIGNFNSRDNVTCIITLPKNPKMGEIELEYCDLVK